MKGPPTREFSKPTFAENCTTDDTSFILNESLDKMQGKIDDILRNLAQHDIDAFTNNTQFIGQRYADEDNPFR